MRLQHISPSPAHRERGLGGEGLPGSNYRGGKQVARDGAADNDINISVEDPTSPDASELIRLLSAELACATTSR